MKLKAYIIREKELREIRKIENFDLEGCYIYVKGKRKPYRFYNHCTNDEVYLLADYEFGEVIKLSDGSRFNNPN